MPYVSFFFYFPHLKVPKLLSFLRKNSTVYHYQYYFFEDTINYFKKKGDAPLNDLYKIEV